MTYLMHDPAGYRWECDHCGKQWITRLPVQGSDVEWVGASNALTFCNDTCLTNHLEKQGTHDRA